MNLDRYLRGNYMGFTDWDRAMWPEDGSIIVRSRMVTEKFKVEYLDEGGYKLTPITEEKNDD